jgi:hypothetical protein
VRKQVTWRNPPSTGHARPAERKFYVWQDRCIKYGDKFAEARGWELRPWRWLCTMCDPPACGFRVKKGAWEKIMTVSMPHHFRVRGQHHKHVATTHGR